MVGEGKKETRRWNAKDASIYVTTRDVTLHNLPKAPQVRSPTLAPDTDLGADVYVFLGGEGVSRLFVR